MTNDVALVKKEILATKWQRGFTNLAQGFVLADTVFQQGGRGDAQSAVLVLWDGMYSFGFETGQKARMLKDKGTMIYMAPINAMLGDKEKSAIRKWASYPWETNYEHIPGVDQLGNNMEVYIQKVLVKFCPAAVSPSGIKVIEEQQGFITIRDGAVPSKSCSKPGRLGEKETLALCAEAVAEKGETVFSYSSSTRECRNYATFVVDVPTFTKWKADPQRTGVQCQNNEDGGSGWTGLTGTNTYCAKPLPS